MHGALTVQSALDDLQPQEVVPTCAVWCVWCVWCEAMVADVQDRLYLHLVMVGYDARGSSFLARAEG